MSEIPPHGEVTSEQREHVLVVTVDRQKKRNAFTPKMMRELALALTALDESPELFCGVLSFAGEHSTAGLEMPLFFGAERDEASSTEGLVDPFGLRRRCRKPVVAAVQGITFTVGLEMMLAADIAIAAEDCRFSQLEAKRGLAPLGGATFRFLQRAGWGDAMYHLLLCDEFGAEEARRIGFVQEVVAPGEQVQRAIEIAELIASNAPLGIQATKAAGIRYQQEGEAAAIAHIAEFREQLFASEDFQEGLASFRERRPAKFQGR